MFAPRNSSPTYPVYATEDVAAYQVCVFSVHWSCRDDIQIYLYFVFKPKNNEVHSCVCCVVDDWFVVAVKLQTTILCRETKKWISKNDNEKSSRSSKDTASYRFVVVVVAFDFKISQYEQTHKHSHSSIEFIKANDKWMNWGQKMIGKITLQHHSESFFLCPQVLHRVACCWKRNKRRDEQKLFSVYANQ